MAHYCHSFDDSTQHGAVRYGALLLPIWWQYTCSMGQYSMAHCCYLFDDSTQLGAVLYGALLLPIWWQYTCSMGQYSMAHCCYLFDDSTQHGAVLCGTLECNTAGQTSRWGIHDCLSTVTVNVAVTEHARSPLVLWVMWGEEGIRRLIHVRHYASYILTHPKLTWWH